jgi:hypothetical protein
VYAKHLYVDAAVFPFLVASNTITTWQIRVDDNALADGEAARGWCGSYFAGKLMPENSGIIEKRM